MTSAPLRLRVMLFFALIASGNVAAVAAGIAMAWRRAPDAAPALMTAGLVAAFGTVLVTVLVWLLFDEHVAKAVNRLAAALRARAHGGVATDLDTAPSRHLGDLGPAAAAICSRLAAVERAQTDLVADAVRSREEENAHLAAILSEIPVAIMVVDEAQRIMLYDRQCVHVLGQVSALCLGRPIHDYLDREGLRAALDRLAKGDGSAFVDADLTTADGSGTVRARIRPAVQGRGFMLAMEVDETVVAERPLTFDFGTIDNHAATELADTPLSALSYVIFDTETTGLDTTRDDIVQIGAVRVFNGRIVPGESFETLVDPGRPIPAVASRVHGITGEMVAGAPDVTRALRAFHGFAHDAVLVAHNAPFDMAFLDRTGAEVPPFDNPLLDTVLLSAAVFGGSEVHTLDAIADRLDVRIDSSRRHTAMGDALATAHVMLKLLPMLETQGIRTFGDAVAAMRKQAHLLPDLNTLPDR
ncbi:3'-5' exonuclease [Jannaschia rubra]|uniref:3'-5' exonuclease n=1 Tax=Jannaschia rubra TaxID=282197 RepID=UPI00248FB3D5|nr:exonuclease domain-containing protein [Jannaschia rubra]